MKGTRKPHSTISYNTEAFLKQKLDDLVRSHKIMAYQYIKHQGEDGDKAHIHLRIEPNVALDLMDIQEVLTEYVIGEEKPRRCRPFRPSKEEDWFLYAVHDKEYLELKYHGGDEKEKLPYDWHDIIVPDNYDLDIAWTRAKQSLKYTQSGLVKAIKEGTPVEMLLADGANPFSYNAIAKAMSGGSDYVKLRRDYNNLQEQFEMVMDAIEKAGYQLGEDEDGRYKLIWKE